MRWLHYRTDATASKGFDAHVLRSHLTAQSTNRIRALMASLFELAQLHNADGSGMHTFHQKHHLILDASLTFPHLGSLPENARIHPDRVSCERIHATSSIPTATSISESLLLLGQPPERPTATPARYTTTALWPMGPTRRISCYALTLLLSGTSPQAMIQLFASEKTNPGQQLYPLHRHARSHAGSYDQ
jgi:hypothetical protein